MAPSPGHLHKLVMRNVKLAKYLWRQASQVINYRVPISLRPSHSRLQPAKVPIGVRQPIHHLAQIRQSQSRWFSTTRRFGSASGAGHHGIKYDKASFPKSNTGNAVNRLTGRSPFASTLRPNLTGGTLGRTAGGYSLGSGRVGGARYFSHGPAAPAQVVQNVSQAVRTFWLAGKKAQYDGVDPKTGEKRYRTVSALQHETSQKLASLPRATPGSYIDFKINPTITALTPLNAIAGYKVQDTCIPTIDTLNSDGLLDILSVDFARALKDLAAILFDLKQLSSLGDLPITYQMSSILRVHFPGCDAETVEKLCEELDIKRGIVTQDESFDSFVGTEIALLFPYAPSMAATEMEDCLSHHYDRGWANAPLIFDEDCSTRSEQGFDLFEPLYNEDGSPWITDQSPEDYGSLKSPTTHRESQEPPSPLEYHDFEGIYRFIELCDASRRQTSL